MCVRIHWHEVNCEQRIMKSFIFYAICYCIQLLPSSTKGTILTKDIPVACPGEVITFTCSSEGFIQRWQIYPPDRSSILVEEVFEIDVNIPGETSVLMDSMHQFNFTLISSEYDNLTSLLMTIASESQHNVIIECGTPLTLRSDSIQIVEIPPSPQYFAIISKEYHENVSSVTLVWRSPGDQSQILIDYYQLIVQTGASNITFTYNSTETMAVASMLPYDSNIMLSLTAHNCIGEGAAVTIDYSSMRCGDINMSIYFVSNPFSQTPGSQLQLICISNPLHFIVTECQEDGIWQPDPINTTVCDASQIPTIAFESDSHESTSYYVFPSTSSTAAAAVNVAYALSASAGLTFMLLVIAILLILCYVVKQKCRRKPLTTADHNNITSTTNPGSLHMYEEVYPIYEAISAPVVNMERGDFQQTDFELLTSTTNKQVKTAIDSSIAQGIESIEMKANEAYCHGLAENVGLQATNGHDYEVCDSVDEGSFNTDLPYDECSSHSVF